MPIAKIQTPDGRIISLEVPEGATQEQIIQFVSSQDLSTFQPVVNEVDPDVPTEEALQSEQVRADAIEDPSIGEQIKGVGEALLTTATGATGGALGLGVGNVLGAAGELTGILEEEEAKQLGPKLASELTFQPRTETGQDIVSGLGQALGALPPILGTTPLASLKATPFRSSKAAIKNTSDVLKTLDPTTAPATLNRLQDVLPDSVVRSPKIKRAVIAEQVRSGSPNVDIVTKSLNNAGELVTNKTSKRALNLLSKDIGQDKAAQTVSVIENMTPSSKSQVSRMLDIIDKGRKEPIFGQTNRPSDILGDAVANRAKAIVRINETASKRIGDVAKNTKTNVDINAPINNFESQLNDLGVSFSVGDDGWITPDFSRSKFVGGSQKDMTVLINELKNGNPAFEVAHKLKRQIRDNIDFDSVGPSQLKGESEAILKQLSRGIDEVLDTTSPDYKLANEKFAQTVNLKDRFDKLAGKDVDIFGDMSSKALGGKARRLVSNAESRIQIEQLINDAEGVLSQSGIRFKDDIPSLNHTVTQLENAFKIEPPGSLQGRVQRAGVNLASGINPKGQAAEVLVDKVFNLTKPDFNKKMRAFRSLTQQGNK